MTYFKAHHVIRNFFEIKYFMNSKKNFIYLGRYFILRKPYYVWKELQPLSNLENSILPYFEYKRKNNIIIITKKTDDNYYNNEECWKFNNYVEKGKEVCN